MPTAKPRYDSDGTWKYRTYTEASWNALTKRVQKDLRRYYPDKNATSDPSFGHPADDWAIGLLNVAHDEISMTNWLSRRLTNEELRAERADILKILNRADKSLSNLSHDLSVLFDHEVDALGCRDQIKKLIMSISATDKTIGKLPKANKARDVEHAAAIRVAHCILPMLKGEGISTAATADMGFGYISDAIKILKTIGDALGLSLAEATWKRVIIKAKLSLSLGQ